MDGPNGKSRLIAHDVFHAATSHRVALNTVITVLSTTPLGK